MIRKPSGIALPKSVKSSQGEMCSRKIHMLAFQWKPKVGEDCFRRHLMTVDERVDELLIKSEIDLFEPNIFKFCPSVCPLRENLDSTKHWISQYTQRTIFKIEQTGIHTCHCCRRRDSWANWKCFKINRTKRVLHEDYSSSKYFIGCLV